MNLIRYDGDHWEAPEGQVCILIAPLAVHITVFVCSRSFSPTGTLASSPTGLPSLPAVQQTLFGVGAPCPLIAALPAPQAP